MTAVVGNLALILTVLVAVPSVVLCVECVAALLPRRHRRAVVGSSSSPAPSTVIIVPAHNEEAGLAQTLASLQPQLTDRDRVLVIADNCTDGTADVARSMGVEVLVRTDTERRGKAYALEHAVRHLAQAPPDIVLFVDADCILPADGLRQLVDQVVATKRPAQAIYLIQEPAATRPVQLISRFAFTTKNLVRPSGLHRLGLPCLLTGSGMAMPWPTIAKLSLGNDCIVEDMRLGVDLAINGEACHLCPDVTVTSTPPVRWTAAMQQRRRWEHGHLQTIVTHVPRLLWHGVSRLRLDCIAMALELAVPPMSLLALLLIAAALTSTSYGVLTGDWRLTWIMLGVIAANVVCLELARRKYMRHTVPARVLAMIPLYIAMKVPIYLSFPFRRQKKWVRTERATEKPTIPIEAKPVAST